MGAILVSHKTASTGQAGQISDSVKRKSSLVSHFPLPTDLWPCCISVVPALAAAQHPPALPGAAVEHPNEKDGEIKETSGEDLNTDPLHPPALPTAYTHL